MNIVRTLQFLAYGLERGALSGLLLLGMVAFGAAASPAAAAVDDGTLNQQITALRGLVAESMEALAKGDIARARQKYHDFDETWDKYEDGVTQRSRDAYRSIEDAMDGVKAALVAPDAGAVDQQKAGAMLRALDQ